MSEIIVKNMFPSYSSIFPQGITQSKIHPNNGNKNCFFRYSRNFLIPFSVLAIPNSRCCNTWLIIQLQLHTLNYRNILFLRFLILQLFFTSSLAHPHTQHSDPAAEVKRFVSKNDIISLSMNLSNQQISQIG